MHVTSFKYEQEALNACASGDENACVQLFSQHQAHYKRKTETTAHSNSRRYQIFLDNVKFIYEHENDSSLLSHKVVLNKFSDMDELPLFGTSQSYISKNDHNSNFGGNSSISIIPIENIGDLDYYLRRLRTYHPREQDRNDIEEKKYDFVSKSKKGKYSHDNEGRIDTKDSSFNRKHSHSHGHSEIFEFNNNPDDFKTYLNWATNDNPDGVPLVHPPMDQGSCGSCWAWAATGTLEAIASRKIGWEAYHMNKNVKNNSSNERVTKEKNLSSVIAAAQHEELMAFNFTNLSVQELVDCDTQFDLGCTGGNPIMAFHYIHKHGLVQSMRYPYLGAQGRCHHKRIKKPIATAESWGVLKPEDEENMQMVLRKFGPIAVGMNGSEKAFIHYKGGIFDSKKCSKHQNHAMLIVGYGEERRDDGLVKYWIARNSWGLDWGEEGMARVARRNKSEGSVCGISKNPSIALGAVLLESYTLTSAKAGIQKEMKHINVNDDRTGENASILRGNTPRVESKIYHSSSASAICPNSELYALIFFFILMIMILKAVTRKGKGFRFISFISKSSSQKSEKMLFEPDNRSVIYKTYGSTNEAIHE